MSWTKRTKKAKTATDPTANVLQGNNDTARLSSVTTHSNDLFGFASDDNNLTRQQENGG